MGVSLTENIDGRPPTTDRRPPPEKWGMNGNPPKTVKKQLFVL